MLPVLLLLTAAVPIVMIMNVISGMFSGWFDLRKHYPDRDETALLTIRNTRMLMASTVSAYLTVDACATGLRVSNNILHSGIQKPFFVPWSEIHPETLKLYTCTMTLLRFGKPQIGMLRMSDKDWSRLSKARRPDKLPASPYE